MAPTTYSSTPATMTMTVSGVPCGVNTRLVAAVQTRAGARCHQSASLLSAYYMTADVYRKRLNRGDGDAAYAARQTLRQVEQRLREFLTSTF